MMSTDNFNSAEEKNCSDHKSARSKKSFKKKTHRSKKRLPGRKQRLRRKLQFYKLQGELAKQKLKLAASTPSLTARERSM